MEGWLLVLRILVVFIKYRFSAFHFSDNKNSPAMSKLKQLVLGDDSPPAMNSTATNGNSDEQDSILLDESPIEKTALGNAIDSLMVNWCQLLTNVSSRPPVPPPSTIDHVKEVAEICVKHFRDACLEVSSELTRIDLQWQMDHPEEVYEDELRDIEESISRQQTLLTRANGVLERRKEEFFASTLL